MIRTFRIYQLAKRERLTESEIRRRFQEVRLRPLLTTARPPLARVLSDLYQRLKDDRIRVVGLSPRCWELVLTGTWPSRSITVATELPPRVPVRVSAWVRRTIPWVIVFEANRGLSEAVARLVAAAMAGDPSQINSLTPDLSHWRVLEKWAETDGAHGAVLGGRFYHAKAGDTDLEWISLRCTSASNRKLLRECMRTSAGIGELLIHTPWLKPLKKSLICRVNRSGVVRVYGDEISDEAIEALLVDLQVVWGFLPGVSKPR